MLYKMKNFLKNRYAKIIFTGLIMVLLPLICWLVLIILVSICGKDSYSVLCEGIESIAFFSAVMSPLFILIMILGVVIILIYTLLYSIYTYTNNNSISSDRSSKTKIVFIGAISASVFDLSCLYSGRPDECSRVI
ncbi:MAG: hypothetical protein UZ19_OD1000010, partial [Parcubacteria bacterium OLB19]